MNLTKMIFVMNRHRKRSRNRQRKTSLMTTHFPLMTKNCLKLTNRFRRKILLRELLKVCNYKVIIPSMKHRCTLARNYFSPILNIVDENNSESVVQKKCEWKKYIDLESGGNEIDTITYDLYLLIIVITLGN